MAGKNVLIVYAHQEPKSLNGSLKDIAVTVLSKQGCRVTVSDLYAMEFEPRATRKDISGPLSNPESFNYGMEMHEAYRTGRLASDVVEEQKKVQEADLVIFQNKSALLSFTTGGDTENFSKAGASGDFRYLLWPLQHGVMHFCGFKVLAPQISFAPETESEERRREMLSSWARRLETIWEEKPINCTPPWYFD
ncbi:ribosyldihydronicotinamide dehydrogenase [quinone] isoform X5 [Ornithorhynchus anatinus]|uniref:ribosyldihydronicotinamide dehydrogenase [quinone] isoform X5 n=1 Tax=Ornithorhynchus anatinus TaxID=9258 RepID=UPI0007AA7C96|nr:ribosyldihydronicotinamide dehydrogenase [quinone] isoform X5 [Ornithorhynchus anatinus]